MTPVTSIDANLTVVMAKERKFQGNVQPSRATEYLVKITGKGDKAKISVFKDSTAGITFCRDFVVGDAAERDSYNLSYIGRIVAITSKTVTITHHESANFPNSTVHRLSIHEFCWRNWNFNHAETQAKNSEEMNYL